MVFKNSIIGLVGLVLISGVAHASTLTFESTTLPTDVYTAPTETSGDVRLFQTGSVDGVYASPFRDDTSPYVSVEAGGLASYSLGKLGNSLSFVFGSPDYYNSISFLKGGKLVDSFTTAGSNLSSLNNYAVTIKTSQAFDTVNFSSSINALEFSNVSVSSVPLPASAPMFGAALIALSFAGYRFKRKSLAA